MMLRIKKYCLYGVSALVIGLSCVVPTQAAFLSGNASQQLQDNTNLVGNGAGYDQAMTLGGTIAVVIKAFLGLLGMIFIILILIAGFNWMTAAGEEEKIKKATATIRAAVIGLLIIVAAYAITYFIFQNLPGGGSQGTFTGS